METTVIKIYNLFPLRQYLREDGHNGNEERNALITYINMPPGCNEAKYMSRRYGRGRKNHKVQALGIMNSFSLNELNPENDDDVFIANEIGKEFVKTYYPGREAIIYHQRDGAGGDENKPKWHFHLIISDYDENNMATTAKDRYIVNIRKNINKIAKKYITLDSGKKNTIKKTRTERVMEEKAEVIRKQCEGMSQDEIRKRLIEEKCYSMKQDMVQRIKDAIEKSSSEDEFFAELELHGISVTKKHSSKKNEDYYNYTFVDCPINTVRKTVSSYRFGFPFSPSALEEIWDAKSEKDKSQLDSCDSDFMKWLNDTGESYMTIENGKYSFDFDKRDYLHELYEKTLTDKKDADIVTDTGNDIKDDAETMIELPAASHTDSSKKKDAAEQHRIEMEKVMENNRKNNYVVQGAADLFLAQQRSALADSEINIEETDELDYFFGK